MQKLKVSRRASLDFEEIGLWTLNTWGEAQAVRYVEDLYAFCENLMVSPLIGRPCDHLRVGLRRLEHASHVVFYLPSKAGVTVIRILHRRALPLKQNF